MLAVILLVVNALVENSEKRELNNKQKNTKTVRNKLRIAFCAIIAIKNESTIQYIHAIPAHDHAISESNLCS